MRGSKTGERRGGRQKGSLNKRTEEVRREAAEGGMLPLDYMLEVMRDKQEDPRRRDEMAKAAAPYVHPRLAAVDHSRSLDVSLGDLLDEAFRCIEE
jgi:hypothetical protein